MTHATEQNGVLGKQFAARRRRQAAAIVAAVAVFVAYSLLPMTDGERRAVGAGPIGLLVLIVVVGFAWFTIHNWRCPGCSGFLGIRLNPKSCAKCGLGLSDR